MIHAPNGKLRFSPRDLVSYLEGDFAAWCDRMQVERGRNGGTSSSRELLWATPDEDEEARLAARKGREHEERYLARVRAEYAGLVEITYGDPAAPDLTLAAMTAGAPAIYQAQLVSDGWQGYADFLFRCAGGCACGGHHYTPWDTKLARSAKPYFLVQLCAYADLLEAVRGYRPTELVFVMGQGDVLRFDTRRFFYYYRQLKRSFVSFQGAWAFDMVPDPGLDRGWGRWSGAAKQVLRERDHLSGVAGISRGQVRRLEEDGIAALTALAECAPDHRVRRVSPPVFARLRDQARLQRDSFGRAVPLWQPRPPVPEEPRRGLAMLPPPSDRDVFFDMEGFPYAEGGLEYLFGAVTRNGPVPEFHDWWAHDPAGERAAFEAFVDWVVARWRGEPSLHVYHYHSYETVAVKRLMGRYATREAELDDLLRHGVFVDLCAVVRQGFLVGTPSYSLKDIEHLYREPRTGEVVSAGGSVVEYQRWLDSGEPREWHASPILRGIREYNLDDCESLWGLRSWLLDRRRESGIGFMPAVTSVAVVDSGAKAAPPPTEADLLAARLLARAAARAEREPGEARLDQLVAWLVDFHRREEKPMWWQMFERHDMTVEARFDDPGCLAALARTDTPPRTIKRSRGFEYRFDPEQETKVEAGDGCYVAGSLTLKCTVTELDQDRGLAELKVGPGKSLPDRLCLIPDEHVSAKGIKEAVARFAAEWEAGDPRAQAVCDLLRRRPPRVAGHPGGPLVRAGDELIPRVCDLAARLDGGTLCLQGPPGTGKTHTAAAIVVHLLRAGKRIGVTGHSHKVILNLMRAVSEALVEAGLDAALYKVGRDEDEPLMAQGVVGSIESDEVAGVLGAGAVLVGGTAWVFSREELAGAFDYLFVDEAGQVSLADVVAIGLAARNLVLIGDQMQLAQPTRGSHPGESGLSCLEHALQGHATIPDDLGIFLGTSRRMHPEVCRFISDAFYDSRLRSTADTERQRIVRSREGGSVPAETGILWVPVAHDGCTQSSEEERDAIVAIVDELLTRTVVDRNGGERLMTLSDILLVAPFNMQVRCLREKLGKDARIGSVDKFQGQEAPVVIVSLCASTLDEAPRGPEFLLSPHRLNVAVSRAQALAIVVGSPELLEARCRSVEEMRLLNLLCHLVQYAEGAR